MNRIDRRLPFALAFAIVLAPGVVSAQSAPAPATPAATTSSPIPVRFYGTLWTAATLSNGIESFSNANASAPTAAANPVTLATADDTFLTFQVQQTRLGVWVGEGTPVRGQLELDFIHFDQSSPTTQAFPRLRIAEVSWQPSPSHRLFFGQGWDLYSPLAAHTVNMVGNYFTAGNSGFLRHQLGWVGTFGAFEVAVAVGLPGSNGAASFGNIELDAVPTGSMRVSMRATNAWVGVSFVGTELRCANANAVERRASFGVNAFADLTFGPVNLRAETYYGTNLASLGALTLGVARMGQSVSEAGGWISARYTNGKHQVYGGAGFAAVLEPSTLALGYTPATTTAAAARTPATGPGIEQNLALRVGYQIAPWRGLSLGVEPFMYRTRHKLDAGATASPDRTAYGATLAAMYAF